MPQQDLFILHLAVMKLMALVACWHSKVNRLEIMCANTYLVVQGYYVLGSSVCVCVFVRACVCMQCLGPVLDF